MAQIATRTDFAILGSNTKSAWPFHIPVFLHTTCKHSSRKKYASWELNPNMQEMLGRFYRGLVVGKLERYPVVSLLGPRQCGKTTLAKNLGGRYFDMESEGAALK